MSLKSKVVSASKWSSLSEIAAKAATPLVLILLARLLTPEDFGVLTAAVVVISFSQIFWDAGLTKALIQRKDEIAKSANIVFWTNFGLGILLYVLIFVAADWIAFIFNDSRVALVVKVQGIQLILTSVCSVHIALYQRQLNFKALFWVRLLTTAVPGLAALPLAWLGFGLWALVAGTLLGSLSQLIVLWLITPWRPQLEYDFSIAKEMVSFGIWVTGSGLLAWITLWLDSLIVGAYLNPHDLGLYRIGNTFVIMIFGFLLRPILPVLFSALSKIWHDPPRFKNALLNAIKVTSMISVPFGFGLFTVRLPLGEVIFGSKWTGIDSVIGFMALIHGLSCIVNSNATAYRAFGKPDLETKIMLLCLTFYVPAFLTAVPFGLETFLKVRFALIFVSIPIHIYVARKYLQIMINDLFINLRWIFLVTGVMFVTISILNFLLLNNINELVRLCLVVSSGIAIYTTLLYSREKKYFVKNIFPLFRELRRA